MGSPNFCFDNENFNFLFFPQHLMNLWRGWIKKISRKLCPFTVVLNVIQVKECVRFRTAPHPHPQISCGHTVSPKTFLQSMLYPLFVRQIFVEHLLRPVTLWGMGIWVNKRRQNPCRKERCRTGVSVVLQSVGSQRDGHDWVTQQQQNESWHFHGWRQKIRQISNIHSVLGASLVA